MIYRIQLKKSIVPRILLYIISVNVSIAIRDKIPYGFGIPVLRQRHDS